MSNHRVLRASTRWVSVLWLAVALSGCAVFSDPPVPKTAADAPESRWGPVMTAIASAELYPDGKTVVDLIPTRDPAAIVADYQEQTTTGPMPREALKA